jgi:exodeoxyribonuclease-3
MNMTPMRLMSWNVNGLRAILKKGFYDWLEKESPDVLGLQEIKAQRDQLPKEFLNLSGYHIYLAPAERKGYSGVALLCKEEPLSVQKGLGIPRFDREGRVIIAEYSNFLLYNVYFPNGKMNKDRLQYKMDFYKAFQAHINSQRKKGHHIVFCGDVNTAHKEIDLAHPKENSKRSGFLPQEREWIDKLIEEGYRDTFRLKNSQPKQYTWWDLRTRARERDVGWRIDYFIVDSSLESRILNVEIQKDIQGSDHCPIGLTIK